MVAAAIICSLRNLSLTVCGEALRRKKHRVFMIINPVNRATAGEAIKATTIFPIPIQFKPISPTETRTAPIKPPTRA